MKSVVSALMVVSALTARANPDGGAMSFNELAVELSSRCQDGGAQLALCQSNCGSTTSPDLCAFSDPTLARVAEVVYPKEVRESAQAIASALWPPNRGRSPSASSVALPEPLPALTDVAVRLIQALAMVIADRAQRESAAFVLDELFRGLCTTELQSWFRSTCSLAGRSADGGVDLQAYGSGAPTMELLRTALRDDIRRFPGVVAAEVVDQLFMLDQRAFASSTASGYRATPQGDGGTLYLGPDGGPGLVQTPAPLRLATEQAVLQLQEGAWVFDAIVGVTDEIDRANREAPVTAMILAPRSQWAACALSLPAMARRAQPSFAPDRFSQSEQARGALLAGLLLSPACTSMLKQSDSLAVIPPLDRRLSALTSGTGLWLAKMQEGIDRGKHLSGSPVDGGVNLELLNASLEVSTAALQLGRLWLRSAPGLCEHIAAPYDGVCAVATSGELQRVQQLLDLLSGQLEVARAVVAQDWNLVAMKSVGLGLELCGEVPSCGRRIPRLGGPVNSALALVSATTADDAAKVIDSLASPIGEWRGKMVKGRFTVSLTAHAGLAGAAEWRWGQYGALYERGGAYPQAPTLAFPVGLEFAWGFSRTSLALLLSLIDPFGFLQYDLSQDGRLPGAKLLSVFAPGVHLRLGIDSPFGFGPFIVFRPGFRSWESALNAPGASVLQLGLEVSVDVTLFTLARSTR